MTRLRPHPLSSLLVTLLAVLFLLPGTAGATSRLSCGGWSIVSSPNIGQYSNELSGVSALSAGNVWAVGFYVPNSSGTLQTLAEQWNGTNWNTVPTPNAGTADNALNQVVALSANNIWAVGFAVNNNVGQTLIEHWNGTSWKVVASPNKGLGSGLSGVAAVSANDIWAVGYYSNKQFVGQTLIEHWNGKKWSIIASPNKGSNSNSLLGVSAVSAKDVWAVGDVYNGSTGASKTLTEHWDGTKWKIVASPNPGSYDNNLNAVAAVSTNDVWTVGSISNSHNDTEVLTEHWNGSQWSVVSNPNTGTFAYLLGATAVASNNVWAVGTYFNQQDNHQEALIEQWNGSQWSVVASPPPGTRGVTLNGVTPIPGSSQLWTVGNYVGSSGVNQTLTEYYC